MSYTHIQTENRAFPLRQPENWRVRYPRWMLQLPEDVETVTIVYIGVQPRCQETPERGIYPNLRPHSATDAQKAVAHQVQRWIELETGLSAPKNWEKFYVETGYDVPDAEVWVLYWTNSFLAKSALQNLNLEKLVHTIPVELQTQVGLWREMFTVSKLRVETVFSGNDYQPGLAAIEGTSQLSHSFTGYWGAARDRMPASSDDELQSETPAPEPHLKDTRNMSLRGTNRASILHIRSGQFWARCSDEERKAYESNLEPAFREGMAYLEENPAETGNLGLRILRNLKTNRRLAIEEDNDEAKRQPAEVVEPRLEGSCSGFVRSLKDLETWASSHATHQKIFHGAHAHSTRFGKQTYKLRTWHEVCVLKPGEVSFEYVNCEPRTGLLPFLDYVAGV